MSVPQATSVAEALAETMVVEPASRSDVQKLEAEFRLARQETRNEIDKLRQEVHAEIGKLRQEMQTELAKLRTEMATLKFDLLRWIVPLILAQMAMTLGLFVRLSL
jgi:uncharacterized membrane protein (DUF106 family)